MEELIKITTREDGESIVSARELHAVLDVKNHFTQWFDDNKSEFTEGVDYVAVKVKVAAKNGIGGTNQTDYAILSDCAKELAMMSRVPKGKEVRQYFIQFEKMSRQKELAPLSQFDFMQMQLDMMKAQSQRIEAIEEKVKHIEAKSVTSPTEYYAVAGYASLIHMPIDIKIAAEIGRKASNICKQLGYVTGTIPDPRFGRVKTYPFDVLKEAFNIYTKTP